MKKIFLMFAMTGMIGLASCASEGDKAAADKAEAKTTTAEAATAKKVDTKDAAAAKKKNDPVDPDLPKTTVEFDKTTFDLGDMQQGDKKGGTFKFTNTGAEPLIISSAKGSCGCTVPEWPKEPIAPGESSEITFEFNSKGKKNKQTKTITIQANTDPNPTRLTVKGNVIVPEGAEDAAKKPAS